MNSIFTLIFYITVGFYLHALVSPNHKIYVKHFGKTNPRSSISKFFLSALAVIIVLMGVTTPSSNASEIDPSPKGQSANIRQPEITTKQISEKTSIPFEIITKDDPTLSLGTTSTIQEGKPGEKVTIYTITYTDGKETKKEVKKESITEATPKIIHNGTYVEPVPDCNPNYSGCVENSSYDLDCADIGTSVTVLGYDEYGLDRDGDGYGCESY
jgi:hypothetical protein